MKLKPIEQIVYAKLEKVEVVKNDNNLTFKLLHCKKPEEYKDHFWLTKFLGIEEYDREQMLSKPPLTLSLMRDGVEIDTYFFKDFFNDNTRYFEFKNQNAKEIISGYCILHLKDKKELKLGCIIVRKR